MSEIRFADGYYQPPSEAEAQDLQRAHEARVAECLAARSTHEWEMDLYHPDDDLNVYLRCVHCSAGVDDIYPDGHEFLDADFDGGVEVRRSVHNSPVALVVPVDVEVWTARYWTDCGYEYDAGLTVEQRGPVRVVLDAELGGAS